MKSRTLLFLLLMTFTAARSQTDEAHRLYLQAKKYSFEQKWQTAADLFAQLGKEYPSSAYREEAAFWVGYCLEKAGELQKAYDAFESMLSAFPKGTWSDDAWTHRIALAEQLAQKPGDRYYEALYRALEFDDEEIMFAAASALGRLGDRRALPVLKAMRGKPFFDREAEKLVEQLETQAPASNPARSIVGGDGRRTLRVPTADDRINYFQEHRFEQYRSLARKDDNWSADELIDFAVWHIVTTEQFDAYLALDRRGRMEWLEEFWRQRDPTLGTLENEAREEFYRRIDYARRNFSYYDGRQDFYYAPWDARGEVYIKFGRPEQRTITDEGEFWRYPQYNNVTFFIRPNVTNIFGRSIFISSLDNKSMRSAIRPSERQKWRNFHNEYIFQPGFYFTMKK